MRLVKYTGQLPGPIHATDKLSLNYDFTNGVCQMEDDDANYLLTRCRNYYADITDSNSSVITLESMRKKHVQAQ